MSKRFLAAISTLFLRRHLPLSLSHAMPLMGGGNMFSSSLPTFPPRIALTLEIRHLALYLCQLNLIIAMLCEAPIVPLPSPFHQPTAASQYAASWLHEWMKPHTSVQNGAPHGATKHAPSAPVRKKKRKKKKARMTKNADDICVSCFSAHCPTVHCAFQLRVYVHLRRCARRPILTATHVTRRVSRDVDEHTPRDYVHARIAAI